MIKCVYYESFFFLFCDCLFFRMILYSLFFFFIFSVFTYGLFFFNFFFFWFFFGFRIFFFYNLFCFFQFLRLYTGFFLLSCFLYFVSSISFELSFVYFYGIILWVESIWFSVLQHILYMYDYHSVYMWGFFLVFSSLCCFYN